MEKITLTIGTAGHIDHGKSSLVKALTGTDPDRFIEEQERGMTIDLGFAFYKDHIAFVDVPGHEKFIRNMVAGVAGMDLAALIIAADDGIMPQTEEHLQILRQLGVSRGFVVMTKIDMADDDWRGMVREDIRDKTAGTFLEGCEIFETSTVTGEGLDRLRVYLDALNPGDFPRQEGNLKYYIDRVFSRSGFGTVVTGTLSGRPLQSSEKLYLYPGAAEVPVRGLHVHGEAVTRANPGNRTAVNLGGIKKDDLSRGHILTDLSGLPVSRTWLLKLDHPRACLLQHQQRVRLLTGTSEVVGRLRFDDKCEADYVPALFTGEKLFAAFPDDRAILRSYSPMITLTGARLLFPVSPDRRISMKFLRQAGDRNALELFLDLEQRLLSEEDLKRSGFVIPDRLSAMLVRFEGQRSRRFLGSLSRLQKDAASLQASLERAHRDRPWSAGKLLRELALLQDIPREIQSAYLEQIAEMAGAELAGDRLRMKGFEARLDGTVKQGAEQLLSSLDESGFSLPSRDEMLAVLNSGSGRAADVIDFLIEGGRLIPLAQDMFITDDARSRLRRVLTDSFRNSESLSVADVRDALGVSRKYAVPILEYSDRLGWTERSGDERRKGSALDD